MEQFRLFRLFIIGCALISLMGCRSEDSTPEARDQIYQDLKKEAENTEKALEAAKKAKEVAYDKMRATSAQTMDLKEAQKEYWKATKLVDSLVVASEYLQIHAERRRVEARLSYHKAFMQGKEAEWPDAHEYSSYLINKRIRENALVQAHTKPKEDKRAPAAEKAAPAEGAEE